MRRSACKVTALLSSVLVALSFSLGCVGGNNTTAPGIFDTDPTACGGAAGNRALWGFWQVEIDPVNLEVSIVPLRGAAFNANVTQFLQPPSSPTHMLSINIDLDASDIENDLLAVDVILRHPFPGLPMYRGFDVRGIFMSDASQSAGFDPTTRYANWFAAGPSVPATESVLLNADGYTRWWNPGEFTTYNTIFGYTEGGLASPGYLAGATVNPFKYFTDGLGPQDPFEIDPASRGTFATSPGANTRRYLIQFDEKPWRYNYAADASWAEPDPAGAPNYPIESFPPEANCQEAYKIEPSDSGSTAWYEAPDSNGGYFLLDIEVFDWQASNPSAVLDEIAALWIESPAFDDGAGNQYLNVLAGSYELLPGSGGTSAIIRAQVDANFSPGGIDAAGLYPVLIAVESSEPDTYEPQIDGGGGFAYPDAPLAAFATGVVDVLTESPLEPGLVLEEEVYFQAKREGLDMYTPAICVENDGHVVFAYEEWGDVGPPENHLTYAWAYRSHDDGYTWPDSNWGFRVQSGWHTAGDATKIWPSSHNLSYRTANIMDSTQTNFLTGTASSTFDDGPNGDEAANGINSSIDHANEILQDADKYVYLLGDFGGQITFKRSDSPECLNCTPPPFPWNWYPFPTYTLADPGRLSRVRSSALYSDTMYLAYFEPGGDVIRLAYETVDWQTWDTSTVVWDAGGSGAHSPRDPGLHLDDTGFHVTFLRTDYLTGFNELCYTWSADASDWSEPVVIRSNVFTFLDSPICRYDWEGTSTLGTVWSENEKIWAAFSLDDGATWSGPVLVSETYDQNKQCDLVIAPTGNWHFVFAAKDPSTDLYEIHYRRGHMEWQ